MYIPIYRIAAGVVVLLVCVAEPLQAASFDCAQASKKIEKTVCSSSELSSLDKELGDAYQSALAQSSNANQLKAGQRIWLREVRNQCQTTACLVGVYKQRIATLAPLAPPPQVQAPASQPSASTGKTPNLAQECDALAAHPDDPEAFTAGISDEKLNAPTAILACEAAVKAEPQTPRLHFQLARGYLKANNIESAIEQLIAAGEQGHGAALAFLADLHVEGAPGIDADPALARSLYERAVASGFQPAKKILAEFEDKTDEYAKTEAEENVAVKTTGATNSAILKPYVVPGIVDNIYNRKFDDIEYREGWVKEYLFNIADNIRAICESNFTQREVDNLKAAAGADHYRVGEAAVGAAIMGGMAVLADLFKNPGAYMQEAASSGSASEDPFDLAMKDTEALFQRHMCKTPGLAQFSKNLKAFVENDEAPLPAPDAIMNACLSNPPPSKYNPTDFCLCFVGGLDKARVSQVHRKNLVKNFREAAIAIMTIDRNVSQFRGCRSGF
ncbi:MAG: lysozyme inhibitor LprI family protein [Telluria sp.]